MDGNPFHEQINGVKHSEALELITAAYTASENNQNNPEGAEFTLHLKFSKPLNEKTVNNKNIFIRRLHYNIQSEITYSQETTTINIKSKRPLVPEARYIIFISGKLMSEKGKSLRKNFAIPFEFDGDKISKLSPKPVKLQGNPPSKLQSEGSFKKIFPILLSAMVLVGSYLYAFKPGLLIGTGALIITFGILILESISPTGRSIRLSKSGEKFYNKGDYLEAITCFESALFLDYENKYAQFGLENSITMYNKDFNEGYDEDEQSEGENNEE